MSKKNSRTYTVPQFLLRICRCGIYVIIFGGGRGMDQVFPKIVSSPYRTETSSTWWKLSSFTAGRKMTGSTFS